MLILCLSYFLTTVSSVQSQKLRSYLKQVINHHLELPAYQQQNCTKTRKVFLASMGETELSHDICLIFSLYKAFQGRWGQRTFKVEFWDFNLKIFYLTLKRRLLTTKMYAVSVWQMIPQFWFICVCYFPCSSIITNY